MNGIAIILFGIAAICAFAAHLRVQHAARLGKWASLELAVALIAVATITAAVLSGHWVWHYNGK